LASPITPYVIEVFRLSYAIEGNINILISSSAMERRVVLETIDWGITSDSC